MSSTIKLKRSLVADLVPSTLEVGEVAINVADSPPRLYVGAVAGIKAIPFGGINWADSVKTASFAAFPSQGYYVNGTGLTVSLPASPVDGAYIYLSDFQNNWDTQPLTLNGNGDLVAGAATATLDVKSATAFVVYIESRSQWEIRYAALSPTTIASQIAEAIATIDTTSYVPSGGVIMFSGLATAIPAGYYICDGQNGTPNLIDKFVKSTAVAGQTGGSNNHDHQLSGSTDGHAITLSEMPSHRHSLTASTGNIQNGSDGSGERVGPPASGTNTSYVGSDQAHTHGLSGSVNSQSNEPEFYSLIYIMKS